MTPGVVMSDRALSRYQCELGEMAILLAAERHRRKTGDWPASIAAIDRVILSHHPAIPSRARPITCCTQMGSSASTLPALTSWTRTVGSTS